MDNLNELQKAILGGEQAVDDYLGNVGSLEFISHIEAIQYPSTTEFTKLERGALMIAQGILANSRTSGSSSEIIKELAETCTIVAKAILEEANK